MLPETDPPSGAELRGMADGAASEPYPVRRARCPDGGRWIAYQRGITSLPEQFQVDIGQLVFADNPPKTKPRRWRAERRKTRIPT